MKNDRCNVNEGMKARKMRINKKFPLINVQYSITSKQVLKCHKGHNKNVFCVVQILP